MGVVHPHDEGVERTAAEGGVQRGTVGDLAVHERQQVADRLGLRAGRGDVDDRARIRDAPPVPVAPRHHAGGRARGSCEALAVAAVLQAVGQADAAPILLAPDGQHHLGGAQRPAVRARVGQRAQPTLGDGQVEALDDPRDRPLGRRPGPVQLAGAQELLHGVLVVAVAREQVAVRRVQGAYVLVTPAPQAFQEELPKARVTAHGEAVGGPRHRQVGGAQSEQPSACRVLAERLSASRRHLLEQRRRHQERPVVVVELLEDLRRQVAVERIGLTPDAGDVVLRAPGLEEDARDPAARGLDGGDRVDLAAADVSQRARRLLGREGQVALADGGDASERRLVAHVDGQLAPADEHDAHRWRRVAHEAAERRERLRSLGQPFELVDDQQHRDRPDRLGQEPRGLGMGDPARQRAGADALDLGRNASQRGLEIGHEPSRCGVGAVEGQPRDGPLDGAGRLHDGGGLARAGRGRDPHDRIALDEHRQEPLQARAAQGALGHLGDRELALDDRSVAPGHVASLRQRRGPGQRSWRAWLRAGHQVVGLVVV